MASVSDNSSGSVSADSGIYYLVRKKGRLGPIVDSRDCALIQFDGGSRGNPGPSGSGAVIYSPRDRELLAEVALHIPHATNNIAEYHGLLCGLHWAYMHGLRNVVIEGDSKLIVEQLKGTYKATKMIEIYTKTLGTLIYFDYVGIRHIYRESNVVADRLANEAMDQGDGFTREFEAAAAYPVSEHTVQSFDGFLTIAV